MIAPTFFNAWWVVLSPENQKKVPDEGLTTLSTIPRVVDFPLPLGPKMP